MHKITISPNLSRPCGKLGSTKWGVQELEVDNLHVMLDWKPPPPPPHPGETWGIRGDLQVLRCLGNAFWLEFPKHMVD